MVKYVYDFTQGDKEQKDLLGGKGANLAEMTRLGLPVPPGFTVTTEACRFYLENGESPDELQTQVTKQLRKIEEQMGRQLGDPEDPLLVSVRSGAKFSMPGMMDTVLNIGLNDESVVGLGETADDNRFAWDSYRRLVQMFGDTVMGVDGTLFNDALEDMKVSKGISEDTDLTAKDWEELTSVFKKIVKDETGEDFPQNAREQLDMAVEAVFRSWNTERARLYRRRERIPDDLGTAVNVQTMVYGNMGDTSGTGVCFTRDPSTGHSGVYGDYLMNAQGEDVVAGIRNTEPLDTLGEYDENSYDELVKIMRRLETHYRDMCDIEFTIEREKLWILQTRVGKRTAAAAFRIAAQLVDEKLITKNEALKRVTGEQLTQLMFPQIDPDAEKVLVGKGMAASPGAAAGRIVFNNEQAEAAAEAGEKAVLVRRETNPDDLPGMVAAEGVLTARGGKTSHAAVVARGMGKTCVVGAEALVIDALEGTVTVDGQVLTTDDIITIDGSTGEIFLGEVPVTESPVTLYLLEGKEAGFAAAEGDGEIVELIEAVDLILSHADAVRKLGVRANADTPLDSERAIEFGAEGIGLTRTEHMFLGDRREIVEAVILSEEGSKEQEEAFAALKELQKQDFIEMLSVMDDKPMVVRLLDPPLHEFLPALVDLEVEAALAREAGEELPEERQVLLEAVRRLHEHNPMLGLRGVRLGLTLPGLSVLQATAIAEAAAELMQEGMKPIAELMVPLVGSVRELQLARAILEPAIKEVEKAYDVELNMPIGCMVELPRACVTAEDLAKEAEFFSFGTNDLTQTAWGFSRDDVEGEFFPYYIDAGVFGTSPFETLDIHGIGPLIEMGVDKGRETNPDLPIGVCGEHGGDPRSIHFFNSAGVDYVSCSPFRVPVARLEAGRAAIMEGQDYDG